MTDKKRIRIGRIDYTNVWPAFYYFSESAVSKQVDMVFEVPSGLNRGMAEGSIDIAPISSFAYAQQQDDLMLLPQLSVSAYGGVKSILLFHKKPLQALKNAYIALPHTSATSVHLLKIILRYCFQAEPDYFYEQPDLEHMLEKSEAALLIGDDAIRSAWKYEGVYEVTDLGELWRKWTGEWMSFAVWAVRRQTALSQPELVEQIHQAFIQSKQKSLSDLHPLADTAAIKLGGSKAYWIDYFQNLSYDFTSRQKQGLELYYHYATEMGWLDKPVDIQMWTNKSRV